MAAKWQQWMPFRIDAFRGSPAVQAMHPCARIGYLYLLADSWQTPDCTVPDDPMVLAEKSGLGDELWAIHGPRIMRKFDPVDGNGRLRNTVCFEEWKEAKRVYDKRRDAADRTNNERSPLRSPSIGIAVTERTPSRLPDTRTTVVPVDVSVVVPVDVQDVSSDGSSDSLSGSKVAFDTVDVRILAESVGIFGMREQADMCRLLAVFAKESGLGVDAAIYAMIGRWREYTTAAPSLEWQYGSSYKFFMSGKWDAPENWPRKPSTPTNSPPNPGSNGKAEPSEASAYAMWMDMSDKFRKENPWTGSKP